jgi:hypothetical protein
VPRHQHGRVQSLQIADRRLDLLRVKRRCEMVSADDGMQWHFLLAEQLHGMSGRVDDAGVAAAREEDYAFACLSVSIYIVEL